MPCRLYATGCCLKLAVSQSKEIHRALKNEGMQPGPNINMQSEISIMKGLCCRALQWSVKKKDRTRNVSSFYGEK